MLLKPLDALAAGNTLLKKFHNLEQELETMHLQITELKADITAMRGEELRLESRVSRLEENRETLLARMEAIASKSEQETKVALANAIAQVQTENARYQMDLFRKFLESQRPSVVLTKSDEPANHTS